MLIESTLAGIRSSEMSKDKRPDTRIVDFADPFRPREVGFYETDPPPDCERASSNDVTMDKRGLIYVTDRQRGVHVVEFAGAA